MMKICFTRAGSARAHAPAPKNLPDTGSTYTPTHPIDITWEAGEELDVTFVKAGPAIDEATYDIADDHPVAPGYRMVLLLDTFTEVKETSDVVQIPDTQIAVHAMIRNKYPELVREWIRWHRFIGVDKFLIHDNGSPTKLAHALEGFQNVRVLELETVPAHAVLGLQLRAMGEAQYAWEVAREKIDWVAFIDDDEFIVPKMKVGLHRTLAEIPDDVPGYLMPWTTIGPCGQPAERRDKITMDLYRYGRRERIVKTIARYDQLAKLHNHVSAYKGGGIPYTAEMVPAYQQMMGGGDRQMIAQEPESAIIDLNHYRTRSMEFLTWKNGLSAVRQCYGDERLLLSFTKYERIENVKNVSREGAKGWGYRAKFLEAYNNDVDWIYGPHRPEDDTAPTAEAFFKAAADRGSGSGT